MYGSWSTIWWKNSNYFGWKLWVAWIILIGAQPSEFIDIQRSCLLRCAKFWSMFLGFFLWQPANHKQNYISDFLHGIKDSSTHKLNKVRLYIISSHHIRLYFYLIFFLVLFRFWMLHVNFKNIQFRIHVLQLTNATHPKVQKKRKWRKRRNLSYYIELVLECHLHVD